MPSPLSSTLLIGAFVAAILHVKVGAELSVALAVANQVLVGLIAAAAASQDAQTTTVPDGTPRYIQNRPPRERTPFLEPEE